MEYTNSPLATYYDLSPNYNPRRSTDKIDRITIHHMAGSYGVKTCGQIFHQKAGSSNYGIDPETIACFVEEKNRAWTSSNGTNDYRAITIECANTASGVKNDTWEIADATYDRLIQLCVDICHRYNKKGVFNIQKEIEKIPQSQRASFANNYPVPDDMILLTQHNYFSATVCPGTWLKNNWQKLTDDINAKMGGYIPPAPVADPIAKPVLKKGSKGAEVTKLQQNLNEFGYLLAVDGDFGSGTDRALRGWQRATGLTVDGSYGPASYAKMKEIL